MNIFIKGFFTLSIVLLAACSGESSSDDTGSTVATNKTTSEPMQVKPLELTIFKSPTCGCCGKWIDHVENNGIETKVRNHQSIAPVKNRFHIPSNYQSCHTSVSEAGYFFEGHIPAKYIQAFLANPPEGAAGLAVPGMPMGSPGMEVGEKFQPYQIFLLKKDGSVEVFADVNTLEEQFNDA